VGIILFEKLELNSGDSSNSYALLYMGILEGQRIVKVQKMNLKNI